jgi:hypothetical protein
MKHSPRLTWILLSVLAAVPAHAGERQTTPIPPRGAPAARDTRATLDSIVTNDAFLPAVHIVGASGVFRTDVWIFNPDPTLHNVVDLYYTEADTDGRADMGIRITPDLDPRESVTLSDIVLQYFGKGSSYGLLEVRGSLPLIVTSNTYNVAGAVAGTYGQFSPGQPYRNALGFDNSIFGDLYVTGLFNDPNHRTNAVVMNPTATPLEAGVQLVDSVGNIYKTVIVDVPPLTLHQLNDIFYKDFASANPPAGGPYRLNVFVNLSNGAKVLCYATLTDLRTGDPYLIPGQGAQP